MRNQNSCACPHKTPAASAIAALRELACGIFTKAMAEFSKPQAGSLGRRFGQSLTGGCVIANEMKDYCYSFDQMAEILGICASTLKQRIYKRRMVPPFQKVDYQYWFPKDLFADWVKKQPLQFEAGNA